MTPPSSCRPNQGLPEPDDVSEALRVEIRAPDLTESILDRVALHRTFLDRRGRRLLWVTRCAIGAGALAVAGAVVFVQARYPAIHGEEPRPTPLSDVVVAAQDEAARLDALRGRFEIPVGGAAPSLPDVRLTMSAASPVRPREQREIRPLAVAAAPAAPGVAAVRREVPAPASDVSIATARAAALPPAAAEPAPRQLLPSATEAVHRWAITAHAPSAPRLLRAGSAGELPPIFQGPISNEIRLPR